MTDKKKVLIIDDDPAICESVKAILDGSGFDAAYALSGKAYDLPNRGTNYYLLEFNLTDLRSGTVTWINKYEVKVAR